LKDARYNAVKSLIETNRIQSLQEVFTIVPVTAVKNDIKVNYNTLRRRLDNTELLTLKDIILLAELFEVDAINIFKLAQADFSKRKKVARKKT
jgi:hypothetical protein